MISFRELKDDENDYIKLYNWCNKEFIYKWFEQRKLTLEEITNKYKNKLLLNKQKLLIIQYDNKDIGLVQIYKYENDINNEKLDKYNNVYEFDIFIGEEEYLSKGIGKQVINLVSDMIYSKYNAESIILRPFKNNVRAIKCYQDCGFKIIDEYQDKDTIGNNVTIIVLFNEKKY